MIKYHMKIGGEGRANNMNILCVMPAYHMTANANNNCMQHILEHFKEKGHHVDILCIDNKGDIPVISQEDDSTIITVFEQYNKAAQRYSKGRDIGDFRKLPRYIQVAVKAKCYLKTVFRPRTDYYPADAIDYGVLTKCVQSVNARYDIVLSHSFPFVAHVIAKELRKRGLAKKWYAVKWDPFVYNKFDPTESIPHRQKTAERVLNDCDGIFVLEGILDENLKNHFIPGYHQLSTTIALPILRDQRTSPLDKNAKTVLVYAGAFYNGIRRPDDMLDVLSQFPDTYEFQLFGHGCQKIIEEKTALFQSCEFVKKGRVAQEQALQAVQQADILVNVGNTITNQLPSKVFEYISFGKPIINFYSTDEDLGLKYFRKYPLCYNFKTVDYTQDDVRALIEFCEINKGKQLSFEEATEQLTEYRAEAVCEKVYNTILKDFTTN